MATVSPCKVELDRVTTRLTPMDTSFAMFVSVSRSNIAQPNGPPVFSATFLAESYTARFIISSSVLYSLLAYSESSALAHSGSDTSTLRYWYQIFIGSLIGSLILPVRLCSILYTVIETQKNRTNELTCGVCHDFYSFWSFL